MEYQGEGCKHHPRTLPPLLGKGLTRFLLYAGWLYLAGQDYVSPFIVRIWRLSMAQGYTYGHQVDEGWTCD